MQTLTLVLTASLGLAASASAAIIYNNGPLVTNPGQGFGGADASAITSGTTFGFGMQTTVPNRMADNFVVPAGQSWQINSAQFFGYQTGSTLTSTFTGLTLRIWNGAPNNGGSSVIWGNDVDNVLASSFFSGIYRTTATTLENNQRPIMALNANVNTLLSAGEYWLDWSAAGSLGSGPWAPPISILGQPATGDALQFLTPPGAWGAALDSGSGSQQGLPFILDGDIVPIPEPGQWAMMAVTLLGAAGYVVRRQRAKAAK